MANNPNDPGKALLDAANSAGMTARQLRGHAQAVEPFASKVAEHLNAAADSAEAVAAEVSALMTQALSAALGGKTPR